MNQVKQMFQNYSDSNPSLLDDLKVEKFFEKLDEVTLEQIEKMDGEVALVIELREEIEDLNDKIDDLKEDLRKAESKDTDDFSESEIDEQFYLNHGIGESMVNTQKAELFYKGIDSFSVEELETFLKRKGVTVF